MIKHPKTKNVQIKHLFFKISEFKLMFVFKTLYLLIITNYYATAHEKLVSHNSTTIYHNSYGWL